MNKKFSSNNSEVNELYQNTQENDFTTLITRLKKISKKISLLEKIILR